MRIWDGEEQEWAIKMSSSEVGFIARTQAVLKEPNLR